MNGIQAGEVLAGTEDEATAPAVGRRDWLRAAVYLIGVFSLGSSLHVRPSQSLGIALENWLRREGRRVLRDSAALGRLGEIYLASHPHERNRGQLALLLSGDGTTAVPCGLIAKISRDWLEHDVAVVDGWVLARTEARICALLHLMGGAQV